MIPEIAQPILMKSVDLFFGLQPFPLPSSKRISKVQIVAHRGAWSESRAENSLEALRFAQEMGVHGVELDIRWSRDGEPVICHDVSLWRLFRTRERVCDLDWLRLRDYGVLHLANYLAAWDGHTQLFVELKEDFCQVHVAGLKRVLGEAKNIWLMSFAPESVAGLLPQLRSRVIAIYDRPVPLAVPNCGGITAHYVFLSEARIAQLESSGVLVGTGFADNFSLFCREVNRGCSWVFTNHAERVMQWYQQLR